MPVGYERIIFITDIYKTSRRLYIQNIVKPFNAIGQIHDQITCHVRLENFKNGKTQISQLTLSLQQ
jgi:hypothetical protein